MCQAYRSKMTQKQGFVWLLPGWYKDGWFDTDDLALKKSKVDSREARKRQRSGVISFHPSLNTMCINFRIQEEDQIWFDDDIFVGELPDCNTSEMIEALDGKCLFCTLSQIQM